MISKRVTLETEETNITETPKGLLMETEETNNTEAPEIHCKEFQIES